jgi:ABC-type lipoprotein export system ATPase subunit
MPEPLIRFRGINKHYRTGQVRTHVLRDVDLDVQEGEYLAVVGTSGSGKSTLLNIIGGLDGDYTGEAHVAGQELSKLRDVELSHFRNEKVGFVFQHFNLLDHLSAAENVALPAMFAKQPMPDARARAVAVLERVGIGEKAAELPANLSGGQKQRVAIARALFNRPRLLLCDEPTGNLDSNTGQQIIELFASLNTDDGITLVIVTHEARVSTTAHRVIQLEDGQILADEVNGAVDVGTGIQAKAEPETTEQPEEEQAEETAKKPEEPSRQEKAKEPESEPGPEPAEGKEAEGIEEEDEEQAWEPDDWEPDEAEKKPDEKVADGAEGRGEAPPRSRPSGAEGAAKEEAS